ncbi:MAG: phosphoribosylformylglycinamidine synthase [Clostridia bacterium]|nr:phosphoribosylformylglycinamidine synthase [Clostridia bacterium]
MIYRIFVEKKKELASEALALKNDLVTLLGIGELKDLRILNRYDAENITEELFDYAVKTVFSEPQVDNAYKEPDLSGAKVFAVEYLPGQFDQRADSAAQCIQIISKGERPVVRSAKVYALYGDVSEAQLDAVKKYVINPVEAREAAWELPETLLTEYAAPTRVDTVTGFTGLPDAQISDFIKKYGLAMDAGDVAFCRDYFISEHRDPTITEIRMIDTYWSDHCRHTTFGTIIDNVRFEDEDAQKAYERYIDLRHELGRDKKPVCLMDVATIGAKYLRSKGLLDKLDESEEINACTVKIEVEVDGKKEPWLLLFKNETHNHPTEIEPFGGAATCIGGAIRDPLSGRSYVYGAMRVTGGADPLRPVSETIKGKLPQRKLVTTAAAGYSSYGNQIGLATGIVDELYHDGYAAKRMEIGAVIAAAPQENVRRERPVAGDVVILLGGATGRDGCGGATGSSKSHTVESLETCGAEVQKGNAPEERKLQRLFRNPEASLLIKRCNDFGAGGVSVAIGELADGMEIDLNAVPKKYDGLDGTELAISESQERMAVVVSERDVKRFLELADSENLSATPVAVVTDTNRLVMRWKGNVIVDISRDFLNSNGAEKHVDVTVGEQFAFEPEISDNFEENVKNTASDLNMCSKRGLAERFDSTIGAGSVVMPFGGKYQKTPAQAMIQKISVEKQHTDDCSFMAWGFDPFVSEKSPYRGAYLAVVESVCKLIASGAEFSDVYLTFQEYFERLKGEKSWGKPLAALLGALDAQLRLGIGAIGGKDSMSGSFEDIHVPPTLVSFAVTTGKTSDVITSEFKRAGNKAVIFKPALDDSGLPEAGSLKAEFSELRRLAKEGKIASCRTFEMGGLGEAVIKSAFGNGLGFEFDGALSQKDIFGRNYGSLIVELNEGLTEADIVPSGFECVKAGTVTENGFKHRGGYASSEEVLTLYENKLEPVFSCNIAPAKTPVYDISYKKRMNSHPLVRTSRPRVLIPAFPGTNCEYDSAKAMRDAGADPEIIVVRNLTGDAIAKSVERFARELKTAQIVFIPGGFSGGDEPDGSGKFITAFFRNAEIKEAVSDLLDNRGGLMCGICNGFQALIKLGLVPYGKIIDADENSPTLTFNTISRHQSKIVRTRIASVKSPWLSFANVGDIYSVPISHGEGRFLASEEQIRQLAENGQIATQYADLSGNASNDIQFNPNGSVCAVEGITSPDGRVFGKMGHSERTGSGLYKNVPGEYDMRMFEAAVKYFN